VTPHAATDLVYDRPSPIGAQSQLVHAAIDTGLARGAIEATLAFVRTQARPWIDSGKEKPRKIHTRSLLSGTS
jgi:alkylation response protein AidB-like acyl-CoA dehydrogenase